jgi:WD40 repeat protein
VNFDGPVRVADTIGIGTATITLSFDAWKGVAVHSTTHSVTVLPAKARAKPEPVAPNLIATLIHPDRKANNFGVAFSPDGARLFNSGYPSGILQTWDVASRKEVLRIDTPPGYRGSAEYSLITPDWKTLYVPVEKRSVKPFERDGKKLYRFEYAGEIRAWDLASGKEKDPLRPDAGWAPVHAQLAPRGRLLVCIERPGYDSSDTRSKDVAVVWDLATSRKWKLCDGFAVPSFAPDGKTVAVGLHDHESRTSVVKLLDLASGKELAKVSCPEKERFFSVGPVAPDGSVIAVYLGGKKGAPLEVWFLDARTLEERGKLIGKGDPERFGWGTGRFTPDGKRFVALDGVGNALVSDVTGGKVERTLSFGRDPWTSRLAISPDGKTVAVGWMPRGDKESESAREPDPQDLPQPRVSLLDLAGNAPPRVLFAPHGYVGGLAFSPDGKMLAFGGSGAVHLFDLSK